jgi:hypothetical protein
MSACACSAALGFGGRKGEKGGEWERKLTQSHGCTTTASESLGHRHVDCVEACELQAASDESSNNVAHFSSAKASIVAVWSAVFFAAAAAAGASTPGRVFSGNRSLYAGGGGLVAGLGTIFDEWKTSQPQGTRELRRRTIALSW